MQQVVQIKTQMKHLFSAVWNAKVKVEPMVFLYLFVWSFYLPLYQQYYYVRFGTDVLKNTTFPLLNGSQSYCLNTSQILKYAGPSKVHHVQSLSNQLLTYGQLANRIPSIIIVIIIGPLSDMYGRKPVLLSAAIGMALQSVLAVVVTTYNLNPYWFIPANFLTGVCGDITGILAGSFSYVSDISSKKWRAFRIGLTCCMYEVGVALGSYLCGLWLTKSNCNFVYPMWLVLGCSILVVVWILILVQESLNKQERAKAKEKHPQLYAAFLSGLKLFFYRKSSVWKRWAAIMTLDLLFMNAIGNSLIIVFFLKSPPFDADPETIGIYQALISVSSGVCASAVIFVTSVVLKIPDSGNALLGVLFQFAANILMGFSKTNTEIYIIALVQGVQVMGFASLRTILSKLVSCEEQGALFSIVVSSESVSALLGSLLWPLLLPVMLDINILCNSGSIFFVMAGLDLIAAPLVLEFYDGPVLEVTSVIRIHHVFIIITFTIIACVCLLFVFNQCVVESYVDLTSKLYRALLVSEIREATSGRNWKLRTL